MTVIAINNNKGGSLKTTTTTNLAGVLSKQGKKVLIIDADNQSNVLLSFNKNPDDYQVGLFSVLIENLPPEDAIVNVADNIDVLPSNDDLIGFDFEVIGNLKKYPKPFTLMDEACGKLRDLYDYILIDTPPSLSLMVGNVFTFADQVLVPYVPEGYSMRSLVKVLHTITEFGHSFNPRLKVVGVVATMVSLHTNLHQYILQETREYCENHGVKMFETYIPRSIRFGSSIVYEGVPATLSNQRQQNLMASSYYELWEEIAEYVQQQS